MAGEGEVAFAISAIGGRDAMEDEHVLEVESVDPLRVLGAVFDGHGGADVARLARDRLPVMFRTYLPFGPADAFRRAYAAIQMESHGLPGGAVAATFYLEGGEVTVANAGDAHVVAVTGDTATRLTQDHRLTNEVERQRVVAAGAQIEGPYVCLQDGRGIMPTRTLGDHEFREVGVLPEPAVSAHPLGGGFLVAACDGLWDVVEPGDVPGLLRGLGRADDAARVLAREALDVRRTGDNLTVIVVRVP